MAARQPQVTREQILRAASQAFYERGFSGTSLDDVLARTGVTKGALYHHFECKRDLGCALIDEVLAPLVRATWVEPVATARDPVTALQRLLRSVADDPSAEMLRFGCPLNNLSQEVSAVDQHLRARVEAVLRSWVEAIVQALRRGQGARTVRVDVDVECVAVFIVGAIEGALSLGKATRDREVLRRALEELAAYVESLRPGRRVRRPSRQPHGR